MTSMTTSAQAWAEEAAADRKRLRDRYYTAAAACGILSPPVAVLSWATDSTPGLLCSAALAVPGAVAAWAAHGMRTPTADEIRRRRGAEGETATRLLTRQLSSEGWHFFHDRAEQHGAGNIDHLAVSPCASVLPVLDSKRWRADATVTARDGRLWCGGEDRTRDADKLLALTGRVRGAARLGPAVSVVPVMAVHGSRVAGGTVLLKRPGGVVRVVGHEDLVPILRTMPARGAAPAPDASKRAALHLQRVFPQYAQESRRRTRAAWWERARKAVTRRG